MKAAQARRLANNVKKGKVKPIECVPELDIILDAVKKCAGAGDLKAYFDTYYINIHDTVVALRKLGYSVMHITSSRTLRPKWEISWEAKSK